MKKQIVIAILSGLISQSFAEAPVVDNSEQYKTLNLAHATQKAYPYDLDQDKQPPQEVKDNTYEAEPRSENDKMQLLLSKMDAMQREMASLRGELEVQAHKLGQLTGERASGRPEVARVASQTVKTAPAPDTDNDQNKESSIVPKLAKAKDPVDEQLSYVGAFELVKNRQYDKAIPAMRTFLDNYPNGPYAANAHYWLGELLLLKRDLNGAVTEFKTVVDTFSDSNKLAAAKLKLGVTYMRLGEKDKARVELQHVAEQFPNTSAARLAKAKLNDL